MFEDLKRTGALLKPSDSAGKLVALLRWVNSGGQTYDTGWTEMNVVIPSTSEKLILSGGAISNLAIMLIITTKRLVLLADHILINI